MRRILTYLLTFLYVVANEHLMRNPESNRLRDDVIDDFARRASCTACYVPWVCVYSCVFLSF